MKLEEQAAARKMRQEGESVCVIAKKIGVSKGSVSRWVRDIELTKEQTATLAMRNPRLRGSNTNFLVAKELRTKYQEEGRTLARQLMDVDRDFVIGCALYWAEGYKHRQSSAGMTNTDSDVLRRFKDFLLKFGCREDQMTINVMAHLNNGLSADDINDYWLQVLGLPKTAIRKFVLKSKYFNPENCKKHRHIYGGGALRINDVRVTQMIYGAVQEVMKIDKPEWLVAG